MDKDMTIYKRRNMSSHSKKKILKSEIKRSGTFSTDNIK